MASGARGFDLWGPATSAALPSKAAYSRPNTLARRERRENIASLESTLERNKFFSGTGRAELLQHSSPYFFIFRRGSETGLDCGHDSILKNAGEPLGFWPFHHHIALLTSDAMALASFGSRSRRNQFHNASSDERATRPGCLWSPRSSTTNGSSGLNRSCAEPSML